MNEQTTKTERRRQVRERPGVDDYLVEELAELPTGSKVALTMPNGKRLHFVRTRSDHPEREWLCLMGQATSSENLRGLAWLMNHDG